MAFPPGDDPVGCCHVAFQTGSLGAWVGDGYWMGRYEILCAPVDRWLKHVEIPINDGINQLIDGQSPIIDIHL